MAPAFLGAIMSQSNRKNIVPTTIRGKSQSPSNMAGSVLVYLIVVILIFGVLGVTTVSLFTTTTTSSATPNDARGHLVWLNRECGMLLAN